VNQKENVVGKFRETLKSKEVIDPPGNLTEMLLL